MLIAFPIGLWVASFAFDIFGRVLGNRELWSAGFYCVIGGCVPATSLLHLNA